MQKSNTNEQALESAIEKSLTGTTLEEIKDQTRSFADVEEHYGGAERFAIGYAKDFNAHFAVDEDKLWKFLERSQEEELNKLKRSDNWKLKILERFDRMIKKYGVLRLLKKGLEVEDAHLHLFYPLPLASSSQKVQENYEQNIFSVTRQVQYNEENAREEVDLVLFVNGIPLATVELKNQWTGQNAREHGIKQYKNERDFRQPLLSFGRCVVHFAVDPDEVYMTTRLQGVNTFFLPFNKGNNNGKGNPVNENGHRTAYLWEEVFKPKSLANIIQHFVRFDGTSKDALSSRTLFFPRYHQLDVVRQLVKDTAENGVGKTYLIQHSAGSGKSNSITWAAYQLIETYPTSPQVKGAKGIDQPLFDTVIVVTDRRLLDKQIRDNIKEFSEVKNIVAPAHSSRDLKNALEQGKKIVITTIQKFPFVVEGMSDLSDKNFAVIIDEAHSSQTGSTADKMNEAMGGAYEEEVDPQDLVLRSMKARKMRDNASYFAFTATPKNATLERFGIKKEDGGFKPFHTYSMKQAIEEGFILDVLANYTTYKSYYEIEKSIEDDPEFDTIKAQKKLRIAVERDPRTIATKAEVMVEHFISKVFNTKKLKGKAKGMVVTQSIESAIRYYQAIQSILKDKGQPFKIAIAFSGTKKVDGVEYTEADMNGFAEKDTKNKFDTDEYRLLVVANKYLTGFDQPKLCAMYVDKKLQGVLAVQALSRLNRSATKLAKKTEDLFVLDFFNQTDEIKDAFDDFYTATSLSQPTDVNVLHELKGTLDESAVYEWFEVEDFTLKYFQGVDAQELSPLIDTAAIRFNSELGLEDEEKADIKIKAKQFVKIYGQMASILPYEVEKWEKLYWFLKFLIPKLIVVDKQDELVDGLLNAVDLSTYGLERTKVNQSISLDEEETELDPQNPNPRSAHGKDEEVDPLSTIIHTFNERWFHGWDETPENQRIKFLQVSQKIQDHPDFQEKYANNPDKQNRELALEKMISEILAKQRKKDTEMYRLHAKDDAFKQAFFDAMKRLVEIGDGLRK